MSQQAGRARAGRVYTALGTCERCGVAPAFDRHHKDGDAQNNARANVVFLCRRCHQIVDGRDLILAAGREKVAARQRARTHCVHGHEFTPGNTRVDRNGHRHCRECHRLQERRRRAP